MSKAPGRPLSEYDWTQISRQIPGYPSLHPLLPLSDQGRKKVMKQLAAIMEQLSKIRFEKIGSLFEDGDGHYSIGECLSPSLLWQWRDELDGIDRGPFIEEDRYLDSLASAFVSHARELPLRPHAFFAPIPDPSEYPNWASYKAAVSRWNDFVVVGEKIDNSKNRLSYCIAGQFLREMIPRLSTANGFFTLPHPDLHPGNIFVDENLNITCIIDWGSASSGPITELLAAARMGNSVSPPSELLITAFRSGFGEGSQLGPDYWENANMVWHFHQLVRMLSIQDYTLFRILYELVYKVEDGGVDIPRLFYERAKREDNRQLLSELSGDDLSEEDVKQAEDAAFPSDRTIKTSRLAVARKLTVVSELNHRLLADERLWRWIEVALEQGNSE